MKFCADISNSWNCMFLKYNDMTYILLCIKAASRQILLHKQCHEMMLVRIWTFSQKWLYIPKYTCWLICNVPYIRNIYILSVIILRSISILLENMLEISLSGINFAFHILMLIDQGRFMFSQHHLFMNKKKYESIRVLIVLNLSQAHKVVNCRR